MEKLLNKPFGARPPATFYIKLYKRVTTRSSSSIIIS